MFFKIATIAGNYGFVIRGNTFIFESFYNYYFQWLWFHRGTKSRGSNILDNFSS